VTATMAVSLVHLSYVGAATAAIPTTAKNATCGVV